MTYCHHVVTCRVQCVTTSLKGHRTFKENGDGAGYSGVGTTYQCSRRHYDDGSTSRSGWWGRRFSSDFYCNSTTRSGSAGSSNRDSFYDTDGIRHRSSFRRVPTGGF